MECALDIMEYKLPQLHNFEIQIDGLHKHEELERINVNTTNLARKYGFGYSSDLTDISGYVYSYLDVEYIQVANDLHLWLWTLDDLVDATPELADETLNSCLRILNGYKMTGGNKYAQLLGEVLETLEILNIDKVIMDSIKDACKDYILKGIIVHNLLKEPPSTVSYDKIRFYDSACQVVFPLTLIDLKNVGINDIQYKEACNLANTIICRVNDIYSYPKDVYRDKSFFNYVYLYMTQNKLSLKTSLEHIICEINECYRKMTSLLPQKDTRLCRLQLWCKGNLLWHSKSTRYNINYIS